MRRQFLDHPAGHLLARFATVAINHVRSRGGNKRWVGGDQIELSARHRGVKIAAKALKIHAVQPGVEFREKRGTLRELSRGRRARGTGQVQCADTRAATKIERIALPRFGQEA